MENKKSNSNDIKVFFLVLILVVLAAVVSYFYLYMPMVEKRNDLIKENYDLEVRLINLRNLTTKQNDYIKGINESTEKIQSVLNNYSAGNTPEKSIMMAMLMEERVEIRLPNLSFTQPSIISSVQMPLVTETASGKYAIGYYDVNLWKETMTTNYVCTYEQLKKMIDFINAYPERMNIEAITVAYDSETKGLKGNLTLNLFAVTGTGKEYQPPRIDDLSVGKDNVFGQ